METNQARIRNESFVRLVGAIIYEVTTKKCERKLILLAVFRLTEKLLITGLDGVRVYQWSGGVHERVSLARM